MSFWDSLKPHQRAPSCTAVELAEDRRTLSLSWDDGVKATLTAQHLRQHCPCAECVDEFTGVRRLDITTIPPGLTIVELATVGNYALSFTFGDAHRTGIYEWRFLRELGDPRR